MIKRMYDNKMYFLESGYYPEGAQYDPRAPWNEDEDELSPEEREALEDYYWEMKFEESREDNW